MARHETRTSSGRQFVLLHGRSVAYRDLPGTGTPVLLVHGIGSSGDTWEDIPERLSGAGVRVIVVDLPGHGESAGGPGDYSLGSMASTLRDLLDRNEGSGLLFKIKDDPRITRVGRVLRRFSIDELPQFWNVLVGDMSLVGPRPPLQTEVLGYELHVHRRLYIKPGLTGMWQVNGRSDLSWEESVRLDLYYVENWSLTGDIIILWRTFRVLVAPVGAY